MTDLSDLPPRAKFDDPMVTAKGETRATVALEGLDTLWFNTGTLCNIACTHCYIESSPRNDRLAYLSLQEAIGYLDEIAREALPTRLIGFTGGEPFLNPDFIAMLEETLARGFEALVLTNAMRPMVARAKAFAALNAAYPGRLRVRVSVDDPRSLVHDLERGEGSFAKTLDGLKWLISEGFRIEIAGRHFAGDDEAFLRGRFQTWFDSIGLHNDARDPTQLVIFPEMAPDADPPEITTACWGILHKDPREVMCASARMIVKRKGAQTPSVIACTLLPYDSHFDLGATLKEASGAVALNHRYCASFCVLGGASCGAARPD